MKKVIAIILSILMVTTCLPIQALADEIVTLIDGCSYEYQGDGISIKSYDTHDGIVEIPTSINDYNVTALSSNAFTDNQNLVGIILPETISIIGSEAFKNCVNLEFIVLPETISFIDSEAFDGCDKCLFIVKENSYAYNYAESNSYNISTYDSVDESFDRGVTGSVNYLFNKLSGCLYIYGEGEMEYSLVKSESDDFDYAFDYEKYPNINWAQALDYPWNNYSNDVTDLRILDGVTDIGCSAFSELINVSGQLTLPDSVKSIGHAAFLGPKYSSLDLGKVEFIGIIAFEYKRTLKGRLILPDTLKVIEGSAFCGCQNITEVVLPKDVVLGSYVFESCGGIRSIIFKGDLDTNHRSSSIDCAFSDSSSISHLSFYGNVSDISFLSNIYCLDLKSIYFDCEQIPSGIDVLSTINTLENIYVEADDISQWETEINKINSNVKVSNANSLHLHTTSVFSKSLNLKWNNIDENIDYFSIYRDGVKIADTEDDFYYDTNLETNNIYEYTVKAFSDLNEEIYFSTIEASTEVVTFDKIEILDDSIYVYPEDGFNQYGETTLQTNSEIFKATLYCINENGKTVFQEDAFAYMYGMYNTTLDLPYNTILFEFGMKSIIDCGCGKYTIKVVYTDPDGTKSEISKDIEIAPPDKIINVTALGNYDSIYLSWSKSTNVSDREYYIYRKSENEDDFSLIATISDRSVLTYTDTNVESDTQYYYYVTTKNNFGLESPMSDIVSANTVVDTEAPTITKIEPSTYSNITGETAVTVTAIDNIAPVLVKLYYSYDNYNWTFLDECTSNPFIFYVDTNVLADGQIYIKALAYDAKGNESIGKVVTYNVDNSGPEAVTGLTASTVLASKITLKWNDVEAEDASCFILQQKNKDGSFTTISRSITTLGYNLDNLKPSTEYIFRVAAIDTMGNIGEYSEEYSVKTADDTIAPTITSLSPTASRRNSSIRFTAAAGDDCAIKSISVQVSQDLKNWTTLSTADFASTNKTVSYSYNVDISSYKDGSLYIRAVAEDFSGNKSDTSDNAAFVEYMIDKTSPNTPRDFMACGGDGWICLSWLQGDEEDLGTYSIYRSTSEKSGYTLLTSGLSKVSYYDTTAKRDDTVYYYKLAVCDSVGNVSEMTEPVSAKVAEDIEAPEVVSINPSTNSSIGPEYHTVEALVKDNNCVDSVSFEYKIKNETKYKNLATINNIGYYYKTVRTDIPLDGLADGDKVYVRVYCTDIMGLTSEYSYEYQYNVDAIAPTLDELTVTIDEGIVTLTWKDNGENDLSGFRVYRVTDKSVVSIGSRSANYIHSYTFKDKVSSLGAGDYTYKIVAFDKVGNSNSYLSDAVNYSPEIDDGTGEQTPTKKNQAPKAVINGQANMEVGVEEYFDAFSSTDDDSIVSYKWDFGDGTTSNDSNPIKKYKKTGSFTVKLTVTDSYGLTDTAKFEVTVTERTAIGNINVKVVDENGNSVPYAPVYYNLGTDAQKIVYADATGTASYNLEKGDVQIGCYKSGYLPVTKTVSVLPNATRTITMTIIKEEIVTGKFEVTRMTFNEIKDAGIDVYDSANQNLYSVKVTLKYGGSEVPVSYIRNDSRIISYTVGNSGGNVSNNKPSSGGAGSSSSRVITGLTYIPNDKNLEVIAVLDMNMTASTVKEFFDVKLHIVNNATSNFLLKDNEVDLHVPSGLTMMNGLVGDWCTSSHVEFDSLYGQETKTLSWVLRGDKVGSYDLTADYSSTLDVFNEPVKAVFKTDEPIEVYGMSDFTFEIEVNNEIRYNAFYFNIGLKNNGSIDYYNPRLDFNGIVNNITESVLASSSKDDEDKDATSDSDNEIESETADLLNIRHVSSDGSNSYIIYSIDENNKIDTNIDTLSPGETIYYEYVAYNMIDYNDIAYFMDATYDELEGLGGGVNITSTDMNLYSFNDSKGKLNSINQSGSNQNIAIDYLLDNSNYLSVANSEIASGVGEHIYDALDLILSLDFDVLTEKDEKEIIDQVLVEMITDQSVYDNVDDMIDTQYVKATKNLLSAIKSASSTFTFDDENTLGQVVASVIDDAFSNKETLEKLANDVKSTSGDDLRTKFLVDAGLETLSSAGFTYLKYQVSEYFEFDGGSPLMEGIAGKSKYGGMIIDYALLNPLEAYNDAMAKSYLYSIIQLQACTEETLLLLNTVINFYDKGILFDNIANSYSSKQTIELLNNTADKYRKLICNEAKDIKEQVLKNSYNVAYQAMENYLSYTAQDISKTAIKAGIKKLLGKANIYYALLGTAFSVANNAFGIGDKYKMADTYAITTCISLAVNMGFEALNEGYKNNHYYGVIKSLGLFDDILKDDQTLDEDTIAMYTLYEVKFLTQSRLLGEKAFKICLDKNNQTLLESDKDFDKKALSKINGKFDINAKTVDEAFDTIYKNILTARDTIFNIQSSYDLVKPAAPTVTLDYDNLRTVQSFDDTYEYCLSNGEWRTCENDYIKISPKTVTSVLRVRKKSANGTMAGEITTVTIYAKKELSKNITVKYVDGVYQFSNLNANYDYEVCTASSLTDDVVWNSSKTVKGSYDASVSGLAQSDYIAIRSLKKDDIYEMNSGTRIIPVSQKKHLTVKIEGEGTVTQTSTDGMYFVGDDVTLTANKPDGASFDGWFVNGSKVSSDQTYILEMYNNAEITAKFNNGTDIKTKSISILTGNDSLTLFSNIVSLFSNGIDEVDLSPVDDTPDLTLFDGDSQKLNVEFTPANSTDKTIVWESSNADIISVSANGVITCHKAGVAQITAATLSGISTSVTIEVIENNLVSLKITRLPSILDYIENESFDVDGLKVVAEYQNGKTEVIDDYEISGFDSTTAGEKLVRVSKDGCFDSFNVRIKHSATWTETESPTCQSEGLLSKVCVICGETVETKTIERIDHSYYWVMTKESSTDEDGEMSYECSMCGEIIGTKPITAHVHSFVETIVDPTCDKNGYATYECSQCGYSYSVIPSIIEQEHQETAPADSYPESPHSYSNNMNETYTYSYPGAKDLTIDFNSSCQFESNYDYLYIYNANGTLIGKYSGRNLSGKKITVEGDSFSLRLTSDGSQVYYGFKINSIVATMPTIIENGEYLAFGHNFEKRVVAPTCRTNGYTVNECSTCGYKLIDDVIDETEHNYVSRTVEPTCVEIGYDETYCTICGDSQKSNFKDTVNHIYETENVEATCQYGGGVKYTCENCDNFYIANESEPIPHNYHQTVVEPTCSEDGYTLYECEYCNDSFQTNTITSNGHSFGEWIVRKPSTVDTKGIMYRTCSECGEEEIKQTPKANHEHVSGDWVEVSVSACGKYGVSAKYCSICDEMLEVRTTDALDHNYVPTTIEPTCTEEGYTEYECSLCGDTYKVDVTPATNHIEGEWRIVKQPTCTLSGLEALYCSKCDEIIQQNRIDSLGHDYSGAIIADVDSTCVQKGYSEIKCTRCDSTRVIEKQIDSNNHSSVVIDKEIDATCTSNGMTAGKHCSDCGVIIVGQNITPKINHNFECKVTNTTCNTNGYTTYTCIFCGYSYDGDYVNTIGHNFGDNSRICLVCGIENPNYREPINTLPQQNTSSEFISTLTPTPEQNTFSELNSTLTPTPVQPNLQEQINAIATQYGVSSDTLALTESKITSAKGDADFKGSSYCKLRVKQKTNANNSITVSWSKVNGADGYIVYANKCGSKLKNVKTTTGTSFTQKKLKKGTYYKYVIVAYKNVGDQKVTLSASNTIHIATKGGKVGNPKSVKVNKKKVAIKKGKSFSIKASNVKKDKKIKNHVAIRYESSNPNIATVDSKGKIKAKKKGKCIVYAYSQNGVATAITVTVK